MVHEISTTVKGTTSSRKRNDLKELLDEASRGKFDKVVVSEVSRLGRTPTIVRNTLDALHRRKVSVVFTQLGVETLDEEGRPTFVAALIVAIHSELAKQEVEQLSERIKSGLRLARKRGKKVGRQKGSGESTEDFLKKHRKIVRAVEQGLSLRQIQKLLGTSRTTISKVKRAIETQEVSKAA